MHPPLAQAPNRANDVLSAFVHVQLPGLIPSAFAAQRLASSSEQQSPLGLHRQYGTPSASAQDDLVAAQMRSGVGSHALPLTRHRSASCEFDR